jgi:phosphopantothenoylcysteine synthetase/decarboxylase
VVINDISRADIGFDAIHNEVTIVTRSGERHVPMADKRTVARVVLDEVQGLRESGDSGKGERDGARAGAGTATRA